MCTPDRVTAAAPAMVGGRVRVRNRTVHRARRFWRARRAFLRLDLGRATRPWISTVTWPAGSPTLMVAKSFLPFFARQRSWRARTSRPTRPVRRCSSNNAKKSASLSQTVMTRVLRVSSRVAAAMS